MYPDLDKPLFKNEELKKMQWHVRPVGKGMCIVNQYQTAVLDQVIQAFKDEDKRITERGQQYAYRQE